MTAFTPGSFSASDVSIRRMRAWAWGLVSIFPKSMLGNFRSPAYRASPVSFARESIFGTLLPMTA